MYETVSYEPADVFTVYIVILLSLLVVYPILRLLIGVIKKWN